MSWLPRSCAMPVSAGLRPTIAATVTAGERDGCKSHGLWRLLGIVRTLKASRGGRRRARGDRPGTVAGTGRRPWRFLPAGLRRRPAAAGGQGWHPASPPWRSTAACFSALWVEMGGAHRAGPGGAGLQPDQAWRGPAGGGRPLFGTNPVAFGWPRAGGHPFVFDFATSAIAAADRAAPPFRRAAAGRLGRRPSWSAGAPKRGPRCSTTAPC